jgi:hypothetical protein
LVFKQSLTEANWMPVGPVQTGTGAPLTVSVDTSAGPSGFYQVIVVN